MGTVLPNLEVLHAQIDQQKGLSPVFRTVGRALKKLTLQFTGISRDSEEICALTLESIKSGCNRLTHIDLRYRFVAITDQQYAYFLASFHETLEWAHLEDMDLDECVQLAASCPKARFRFKNTGQYNANVKAIGKKIDNLSLTLIKVMMNVERSKL